MNIYCGVGVTGLQWDGSYTVHTDSSKNTYYLMTMTSENGCTAIQIDTYWSFLGFLKYIFAVLGLLGGLVAFMAGRIFLNYVVIATVITATTVLSNFIVFSIAEDLE